MIPKIIHYCWFGGKPLDALAIKCLESWKKFFPDYEIICWNENNVDFSNCMYIKEAYAEKKWAFVSDYVRFKVMYEHGGIYFDTDVEIIRPFDDILKNGSFMGCEQPDLKKGMRVNPGLGFAVEPGLDVIREIIEHYESNSFYNDDGTLNLQMTIVERTTNILRQHGLKESMDSQQVAGLTIYSTDYFCPMHVDTHQMYITNNTHSIHWYAGSWVEPMVKFRSKVYRILSHVFGENAANKIREVIRGKKG